MALFESAAFPDLFGRFLFFSCFSSVLRGSSDIRGHCEKQGFLYLF